MNFSKLCKPSVCLDGEEMRFDLIKFYIFNERKIQFSGSQQAWWLVLEPKILKVEPRSLWFVRHDVGFDTRPCQKYIFYLIHVIQISNYLSVQGAEINLICIKNQSFLIISNKRFCTRHLHFYFEFENQSEKINLHNN